MKPTKLTNFKFTFHGPMTRQLFELGGVTPESTPGYLSVGRGMSRQLAIASAIGNFRDTPAAAVIDRISERVQMNLRPEWQDIEGEVEDNTEMFCIIEVEIE